MHLGQRVAVPVVGEADDVTPPQCAHPGSCLSLRNLDRRRGRTAQAHLEPLAPELEDPERVQLLLAVGPAPQVFVEQPADGLLPESRPRQRVRREQGVAHGAVELPAEPVGDGHGEATLAGSGAFRRQPLARGFPEQPLPDAGAELRAGRKPRGPLDQAVVEEGHPQLLRGGHGHLVRLDQQIVRQPDAPVELQHPLERGQPLGLRPLLREPLHQPLADARRGQPGEAGLLVVGEGHRHAPVALLERLRGPAQVLARLGMAHERQRRRGQGRDRPELLHPEHRAVDGIAGEHLVRAFAGEDDDHLFPRALREIVERHAGRVRDGLVHVPDEIGQEAVEVFRGDHHLAVLGAESASHPAGLVQLGAAVVREVADGE